jgi:spoIIIJ-associated protein
MTETREFEGKDLEEALGIAADALGVSQAELHYEMLEAGRRGVLGLGVRNVRIRVKPPLEAELPPEEPEPRPRKPPAPKEQPAQPKAPPAKQSRGPRKARRPQKQKRNPAPAKPPGDPVEESVVKDVEAMVLQILERSELELEVETTFEKDNVSLRLQGPDEALLVAKNAELLGAIHLLLNRMSRRTWPTVGRINVVCDGHTKPRDEELVAKTRKLAMQVSETGKTKKLQLMNAYERRLVHLTVREFPGLTSNSDGKGAMKRVRISKVQNRI